MPRSTLTGAIVMQAQPAAPKPPTYSGVAPFDICVEVGVRLLKKHFKLLNFTAYHYFIFFFLLFSLELKCVKTKQRINYFIATHASKLPHARSFARFQNSHKT